MESGYSLADIAAATGNGNNRNGDGMWGDWIWIIVLFPVRRGRLGQWLRRKRCKWRGTPGSCYQSRYQ